MQDYFDANTVDALTIVWSVILSQIVEIGVTSMKLFAIDLYSTEAVDFPH